MVLTYAVRLAKLFATPSSLVYAGNMTRSGLALIINIVVARWLGPEDFGLYYFFIVTMILAYNIIGEGLDPGVVRFYAYNAAHKSSRLRQVVGSSLFLRLSLGLPLTVLGLSFSDWLANSVFENPAYAEPMRLGLLAAFGAALFSFGLAILQARQQFLWRAILTPAVNILRTLSVPVLLVGGWFALPAILWLHTIFLFLCVPMAFWLIRHELYAAKIDYGLVRELFHFSKWSSIAYFGYFTYSNLGVPWLSYEFGPKTAGIYAAGASLILAIEHAVAAIMIVQLPSVSRFESSDAFYQSMRRSLPRFVAASLVLLVVVFLARPIILLIYGPEYEASIVVFQILFVSVLINLVAHPLSLGFLAMNRPHLLAVAHTVPVFIWLLVGLVVIPDYAAEGAAWATLVSRGVAAILIVFLLRRLLKELKDECP